MWKIRGRQLIKHCTYILPALGLLPALIFTGGVCLMQNFDLPNVGEVKLAEVFLRGSLLIVFCIYLVRIVLDWKENTKNWKDIAANATLALLIGYIIFVLYA